MVAQDGTVLGEVCHIQAAEEGGERYDHDQTDEERRDFSNLILLCANHHKATNNVDTYSTEMLRAFKIAHEDKHRAKPYAVPQGLPEKLLEHAQYRTDKAGSQPPRTLKDRFSKFVSDHRKTSRINQIFVASLLAIVFLILFSATLFSANPKTIDPDEPQEKFLALAWTTGAAVACLLSVSWLHLSWCIKRSFHYGLMIDLNNLRRAIKVMRRDKCIPMSDEDEAILSKAAERRGA